MLTNPLTVKQESELAAWIKKDIPQKTPTNILIGPCHGIHYFVLPELLRHFSNAYAVATAGDVKHTDYGVEAETFKNFWKAHFPGQLERPIGLVDALEKEKRFKLEGHEVLAIGAGHARIDDSIGLYVPDSSLMVAGDISYKDMHQWLAESPTENTRNSSIAALETIAVLKPATVLSSHKQRGVVDDVHNVIATIAPFAGLARSKRGRSMQKSCTRR